MVCNLAYVKNVSTSDVFTVELSRILAVKDRFI